MTQGPTDEPVRLGRYELLGEIASGGMATVFLARSTGAGGFTRIVAIKRLHPHLEAEEEFVQMFLDEARLAARIRHPNVVGTIDVEDRDGLYIVMEFIEGVTLLQLAREAQRAGERIPVAVAMRIVLDTLAGLHAAHELRDESDVFLNLVHRDVSPQNVLLGTDGTARLSDFGIAKANARLSHTRDGQLKGKISYMAPEQTRRGETIDRRADIFAMGAVVWEALAGRRLFQGESDVEVLNQLLFEPIPRLKDFAPTLPSLLEGAVMKALDRDPAARYATAAQFGEALERAARMLGGAANHRVVAAFIHRVAGERIAKERTRISLGSIPADAPLTGSLRASLTPAPPPTPSLRPSTNPGTERQAAPRARLRAPTMTGPVFSRARESVAPAEAAPSPAPSPAASPAAQPPSVEHPPLTEEALADATIANAPAPARPRPSLRAPTLSRGVNLSAGSIPSVPPPPAPSLPAVIDFDISEDPDAVPVPAPSPLRASTRPSLLPPAEASAEPVAPPTPDDSQRLPAIELSYTHVPAAPPAPTFDEAPAPPPPPAAAVPVPEAPAPAALPLAAEPAQASPTPPSPPPRRSLLGVLALGLIVLVGALGGLFAAGLIDPLGLRQTETPAPPRTPPQPDAAPAPPADAPVAAVPTDAPATTDASDDAASDASDASDDAASDAASDASDDASDDAASDDAASDASDDAASDDAASDASDDVASDADHRRHHRRRRRNGATP